MLTHLRYYRFRFNKINSTKWLTIGEVVFIFNFMVEYKDINSESLSQLLKAVSDATRRALLTLLCQEGPSRVTDPR